MSETTTLDDMLSDAPVTEAHSEPAPAPEPTGDTLQEAPPAPEPSRQPEPPMVPRTALEDERRKRQDYEKRIAELERQITAPRQPQPQPQQQRPPIPDPFTDPEGYAAHVEEQVSERTTRVVANVSFRFAAKEYGEETVMEAVKSAPVDLCNQLFYTSQDPYGDLMKWHKRQQALTEVGDDLEAYKAKLRAEWEAERNGSAAPTPQSESQGQPPTAPVPKSLGRTPSAQPRDQSTGRWTGPTPLSDILDT